MLCKIRLSKKNLIFTFTTTLVFQTKINHEYLNNILIHECAVMYEWKAIGVQIRLIYFQYTEYMGS